VTGRVADVGEESFVGTLGPEPQLHVLTVPAAVALRFGRALLLPEQTGRWRVVLDPAQDHRQHGLDTVVEGGFRPATHTGALPVIEPGESADRGREPGPGLADGQVGTYGRARRVTPDLRGHARPRRHEQFQVGE